MSLPKYKAFFCRGCQNFATFALIDNKWHCCCCDPLLLPDPIVKGSTVEEAMSQGKSQIIREMYPDAIDIPMSRGDN